MTLPRATTFLAAASLLAGGAVLFAPQAARAQMTAHTKAEMATPSGDGRTTGSTVSGESAPDSETTSGQKITGHTHTHKSKHMKTSPEQPAPATAQAIAPSKRIPDEPNQIKEQVAPIPAAPVPLGSRTSGEGQAPASKPQI